MDHRYFDDVPHGIMFHHFHGGRHTLSQGSISADQLESLLLFIGPERFLSPKEWIWRACSDKLEPEHLCMTLDDNLRCQYDIAAPVFEKYGIFAFWFIHTSVFEGNIDRLELYRHFRHANFATVDAFYDAFFQHLSNSAYAKIIDEGLKDFEAEKYAKNFPFYTDYDRKFRYARSSILEPEQYHEVMDDLIMHSDYDVETTAKDLWISADGVANLATAGHEIGLHSHTHPIRISLLGFDEQYAEYQRNMDILTHISGQKPQTMSHPCDSFNADTQIILEKLGIHVGFRANMGQIDSYSILEIPREDHTNILRFIRNCRPGEHPL